MGQEEIEDWLSRWLDFKFGGHIGFALEALVESFPQSILQMVAMVYFQELSYFVPFFFVFLFFTLFIKCYRFILLYCVKNITKFLKKKQNTKKN